VAMGFLSAAACLLSLDALIRTLIVTQIVTQFLAQCVGLLVVRRTRPDIERPFRMPLYPVPVLIALAGWMFVLCCSGTIYILTGVAVTIAGALAYFWRAWRQKIWPFMQPNGVFTDS